MGGSKARVLTTSMDRTCKVIDSEISLDEQYATVDKYSMPGCLTKRLLSTAYKIVR